MIIMSSAQPYRNQERTTQSDDRISKFIADL